MRLFVRLRVIVVVLAMTIAGAVAFLAGLPAADATPQARPAERQNCQIEDVARHTDVLPARASDADSFTLEPDSYFTPINTPLTVPNPGVLANDTLPEFYETYVYQYPNDGQLYFQGGVRDGNGGFYYCPYNGFVGVDRFTYQVCNFDDDEFRAARADDEDDSCQTAVVTILVGGGGCVSGFPDVPSSNPFCPDVEYLTTYGFAKGYPDGNFHPTATVTRQEAAAVLQRFADAGAPTTCSKAPFPDVPVSSPFCAAISYLVAHKVIAGYADGTFRPTAAVTRGAIALFLYKLQNSGGTPPACTKAPFSDVSVSSPFCGAITWLVSHGITSGYRDGTFHPAQGVPREALAHFVHLVGNLGD